MFDIDYGKLPLQPAELLVLGALSSGREMSMRELRMYTKGLQANTIQTRMHYLKKKTGITIEKSHRGARTESGNLIYFYRMVGCPGDILKGGEKKRYASPVEKSKPVNLNKKLKPNVVPYKNPTTMKVELRLECPNDNCRQDSFFWDVRRDGTRICACGQKLTDDTSKKRGRSKWRR